jgi:hypothetical protein
MVGGVATAQALLISFCLGAIVLRARLAETLNV